MMPYITRRIFMLLYVLFGVSLTIFLLMRLIPGDPALVMLGERATAERIIEVRRGLGLDQPLAVQYLIYLKNILTGNVSATHHYSVLDSGFMLLSLAGVSMPIFWLGLMMIWTFAVLLGWFPPSGRLDARLYLDTISGFYLLDSVLTRHWQ